MKKLYSLVAIVVSGAAIVLAVDPGRFAFDYVDAGGHKLRLRITGDRSPTVVFESGGVAGSPLEDWERVQPAVSRFARTVAYDRAGVGLSEPGPKPRDAQVIARDLHTALHNAGVAPPYVLVGHSFGGPLNRVFADTYPDEVAGMVLLDPAQEEFVEWNRSREGPNERESREEWKTIQACLKQAHQSRVPANVPVVLITAMGPPPSFITEKQREELKIIRPMWLKFHQEWLDRIPGSRHVITENSGHGIPIEEPELVIRTIREVVEQIQHAQPLSADKNGGQEGARKAVTNSRD